MDNDTIQKFLARISQIESSGGKNTDHPEITYGIHRGHKAIGQYGLMPNTINEIITRQKMGNTLSPEAAELKGLSGDEINSRFQENPDLEKNLASYLANYVLDKQNGNDTAAAYAWNHGHNLTPEKLNSQRLLSDDYVGKYNKLKSNEAISDLNDNTALQELAQKRALTLLASK